MKNYYYRWSLIALLLTPIISFSQQYCTPTFSQGCSGGDYIDGVVMGSISNTSTACSPNDYGDYTILQTSVNQTLSYSVTISAPPQWPQGFGVFVDWNQDMDFNDPGEFYSNNSVTAAGGTEVITVTVPSGALLGSTRMRVICGYNNAIQPTGSCGGTAYGEAEDYTLDVQAAPPCIPPSNFAASGITATDATFSWDAVAGGTDFNIEYGTPGFSPGQGQAAGMVTGATGTSTTVTTLSPQTTYDVYIQTNCGGTPSPWSQPISITTACIPEVAPWTETFTVTATPVCWDQSATIGGPWVFTGNPGYNAGGTLDHTNGSQNNYAWIDFSSSDAGVILEGPLVDVSALTVPEVRFWVWSHATQNVNPYNELYLEANDGTTWHQLTKVQGDFGPNWTEFTAVIPSIYFFASDIVQIRFRAETGGSGDFYNDLLLDDVSIVEGPSCPGPINASLVASDNSSAEIDWVEAGAATEWKVEYGPEGFTPGSGTSVLTTTKPYIITGLAANGFYEAYISAACSPGDTSSAAGPVLFNTYDQAQYMEADAECGPGFIDISGTGFNLQLTDDSEAGVILPFPWLVLGEPITEITVGNNGGVIIGTTGGNVSYTMNSGDGFYPFVQDLDHDVNGVDLGGVFWQMVGQAPNRQLVILWQNRPHYFGNSNPNPCTFEMIYDEASNEIYYVYPDVDFGNPNYDNGDDAEIGFRGTQDVTVSINSPQYLLENDCVHLYYTDCPKPANLINQYITADEAAFSWDAGLSGETDWYILFGPAGFDPATGGTPQTVSTTSQVILPGLDQLTEYDIYVMALCANGDTSRSIFASFKTLPLCSDVSSLGADTEIDSLIASWSWTQFDPQYDITAFNSAYGVPGFDPESEGTLYVGDTLYDGDTIADPSFLAGGVYELYVQAQCDTLASNWVGPVIFTMPLTNDSVCGAETLPVDGMAYGFSNDGATVQSGEIGIVPPVTGPQETDGWDNNDIAFTTWFKFTAPASGQIRISGEEADFNGQVALYELTDCSDFGTFQLVAANDDDIDGNTLAPNFTFCSLTPGSEYYLMHDSYSNSQTGVYSLRLSEIDLNAGTSNGLIDVCSKDTISLFSGLSGNDLGGMWVDLDNTNKILDNEFLASTGLAYEVYEFEYRLVDGCALDSIVTSFEVYPPSEAGDDGVLEICKNQPFGLLTALGGVINAGGTWFDAGNNALPGSYVPHGELDVAGAYIFRYVVGNDVCPDDTSIVTVTVRNDCDWLGLEDLTSEGFELYPNPTADVISVSYDGNNEAFDLEILDMSGRVIKRFNKVDLSTAMTINVENFESGVYLVNIKQGERSTNIRFVKQ